MENKTIYHVHHIVPRHMGGTDDASNLIKLTVEEHAEAHRALWEKHGSEYDRIAWQGLTGNITKEECRILAVKAANTGRKQTPEHISKRSTALKEHIKKHGAMTLGKKLGPASDERKQKISMANKGGPGRPHPHSDITKDRMAQAAKNRPTAVCPKCGIEMQKANLSRYHGLDGSKCDSFRP
jgi:hypothetical protein